MGGARRGEAVAVVGVGGEDEVWRVLGLGLGLWWGGGCAVAFVRVRGEVDIIPEWGWRWSRRVECWSEDGG